ncbi:MAG TPA: 50S ribosomal protein L10 [Microthrixaceae bacterium]|nr:50S ribosomal protein L10 [Microthrixaceae bacterium]
MDNPRPEKVAVVDEVREKLSSSDAVLFTEYRGLSVGQLEELRTSLRDNGGEYRVYKNSLVRLAAKSEGLSSTFSEDLSGPTAIAFVGNKPDGTPGDAVMVAKALKAFAKANPQLIVKGGLLGDHVLDADGANALAEVAPREELLARFAGGLAAPMREFAALMQAVPASFAYGLQALIEAGGAAGAPEAPAEAPAEAAAVEEAPAVEAEAAEEPAAAEENTAEENTDAEASADTTDETPADDAAAEQE